MADGEWQVRAMCPCGWSVETSHGDIWYAQQRHPVCPACGEDSDAFEAKTVRWKRTGRWFQPWKGQWVQR